MAKKKIAPIIYIIAFVIIVAVVAVLLIRSSQSPNVVGNTTDFGAESINMTITKDMSPADAVNKLLGSNESILSSESDSETETSSTSNNEDDEELADENEADSTTIKSESMISDSITNVTGSFEVVNSEENIAVVNAPGKDAQGVQEISEQDLQSMIQQANLSKDIVPLNIIFVDEGDYVYFPNIRAADADRDDLTITFGPPLNTKGEWQTKKGDAGRYNVTVTVSDGIESSKENIIIVVEETNFPPVITIDSVLYFKEGETVKLATQAVDPEGENVKVSYSGYMNSSEKYLDYSSAGDHLVRIRAEDGVGRTIKTITLKVDNVNRRPRIEIPEQLQYIEGEFIDLKPRVIDADNDDVSISYEGWMTSSQKQTTAGDAGVYKVLISATDGAAVTTQEVALIITEKNRAPFISIPNSVEFIEGTLGELKPIITDPDNDEVTVIYSGWMSGPRKQVSYTDAGVHEVTITASDGKDQTAKTVIVTVQDKNRAPTLKIDDVITTTEGQTVTLTPVAEDEDGNSISFTYSGWMDSASKDVADGEAGNHTVKITATDGQSVVSKTITVVVIDRNRPPSLSILDVYTYNEGDTILLQPVVSDPDKDRVSVTYSGWMNSNTKKLGYDDAGVYEVTVTASDGLEKTTKVVTIKVNNKNRPPFFVNIL